MSSPSTSSVPSTQVELTTPALANLTGIFILVGATSSTFGPLLTAFSHHFAQSLAGAGVVLSVYFVGALIGVLPGWWGLRHRTGRQVLTSSLVVVAAGLVLAGLVDSWPVFLTGIFVLGLGFGSLDMSLNVLLSRTAPEGRAHRLSFANAGYGLGAVICPLLIILTHPHNFPTLYLGVAVVAIGLTTFNRGVHAPAQNEGTDHELVTARRAQRRPILIAFVLAYVFYVAAETSASGWMASQLQREGYSTSVGSLVTAGFWLGMTIGRSLGGPLHHWMNERRLVIGGLIAAVVLDVGATSHVIALVSYPLLGLILASVFPMGLLWYGELLPFDSDGITIILFAMMAGGVIGPGTVSLLVSHFGVHAVPFGFVAFTMIDLAVFLWIRRLRPVRV